MNGKIRISDLRAVAAQRLTGYLDEILGAGRIENDILHIEHAVYSALRKKYSPQPNSSVTTQTKGRTVVSGVGTELKKLLSKLGLKPAPNCKCNQHITEMNQKGIIWCEENTDTILGWLKEESDRAKLPFTNIGARIIVKRAIHNTKKKVGLNNSNRQEK